jgi:hypothetical protein
MTPLERETEEAHTLHVYRGALSVRELSVIKVFETASRAN